MAPPPSLAVVFTEAKKSLSHAFCSTASILTNVPPEDFAKADASAQVIGLDAISYS